MISHIWHLGLKEVDKEILLPPLQSSLLFSPSLIQAHVFKTVSRGQDLKKLWQKENLLEIGVSILLPYCFTFL